MTERPHTVSPEGEKDDDLYALIEEITVIDPDTGKMRLRDGDEAAQKWIDARFKLVHMRPGGITEQEFNRRVAEIVQAIADKRTGSVS